MGEWKISIAAHGGNDIEHDGWRTVGHSWIIYENTATGELHTAGAYATGAGAWADGTGAKVAGAQWDIQADLDRTLDGTHKHELRSVVVQNPILYHRKKFGGTWMQHVPIVGDGDAGNNCASYARDVWYEYTGEFFWFNQQGPIDNPKELEVDIKAANEAGPASPNGNMRPWPYR